MRIDFIVGMSRKYVETNKEMTQGGNVFTRKGRYCTFSTDKERTVMGRTEQRISESGRKNVRLARGWRGSLLLSGNHFIYQINDG